MGLALGGLQSGAPSVAQVLAALVGQTLSIGSRLNLVGGLLTPVALRTDVDANFLYCTTRFRAQNDIYSDGKVTAGGGYCESTATGAAATAFYASGATSGAFQAAGLMRCLGGTADGGTAVACAADSATTYSTAGAKIYSFRNNTVEVSYVDKDGQYVGTSFTDDSGTTGNRTVNKVRGFNAFAAGTSAITITNSFVTASSQIICTLMTNDATALLKNAVPGAGSFTITLNANTTGITKVAWFVVN